MENFISILSLHNLYMDCSGVSIDSRTINPSEMFFALRGDNFDGHKYIEKALEGGAKYIVIDDKNYLNEQHKTLIVPNVEKALQDLARFHRTTLNIPTIGLTGSNGKTTTKELIASVLSKEYNVFSTKGNLNNHLGVPISILSIKRDHEIAIIEMGANHSKEIKFLSEIAMPEYGLITNIGKAHLEGFGNIEGVRMAKTELYDYLRKVNGSIFYNIRDKFLLQSLLNTDNTIPYDPDELNIISEFPTLKISYQGENYQSGLSGGYNAINMLAAITIGKFFNVSVTNIINGLLSYKSTNNRSEIKDTAKNKLILDAYNANPSSMKVSIDNISRINAEKKVLIIGHMLELGIDSTKEHQDLIDYLQNHKWEQVLIIGHEFKMIQLPKSYQYFESTTDATAFIKQNPITESTILLKGSRGIALENLLPYL